MTLNLKFVQSTFFLSTICKKAYQQYVLDLVSRLSEHQSQIEPDIYWYQIYTDCHQKTISVCPQLEMLCTTLCWCHQLGDSTDISNLWPIHPSPTSMLRRNTTSQVDISKFSNQLWFDFSNLLLSSWWWNSFPLWSI